MTPSKTLFAALLAAGLLAGCSAPTGGGPFLPLTPDPAVAVQEEAAPSATFEKATFRVDEVHRRGNWLTLGVTAATAGMAKTIYSDSLRITTDTGVKVPVQIPVPRELPNASKATFNLSLLLPEAEVTALHVQLWGSELAVDVPLPKSDGGLIWREAPVREVALPPTPYRTKDSDVVFETLRSEGLITELTYRGLGTGSPLAVCTTVYGSGCAIKEADGTTHPLIGATDSSPVFARQRGTLRFLGELDAQAQDLAITISGAGNSSPDPFELSLPAHADAPVRAVAGDTGRSASDMKPITLRGKDSGASAVLKRVEVLSDRVEIHATLKAGSEKDFDFSRTGTWTPSILEESNGSVHLLIPPKEPVLELSKGRSVDAVLVFAGTVPNDVTSLSLTLGGYFNMAPLTTTLTIPAGDTDLPDQGATNAEVAAETPAPQPRVTPSPAPADSPSPTAASMTGFTSSELPSSASTEYGAVRSGVSGVSVGTTASAPDVDPKKDAEAERSLKELGAQKTAEGWVLTLPETVTFDYNKAELKPGASATITKVAKLLAYYDKAKIAVQGHTDNTGDAAGNLDLSQRRADAVAQALASGGVQMSRMKVEGFGLTRPVASNADEAGRAKNRRVEIVLRETA